MPGMLRCRDTVHTAMIDAILSVTPPECFDVEICDVTEGPAGHKVFLHKAHQPFHAAFCKRMPWLAQFRGEANRIHEGFIVFIPYRMAICVAPVCDTLKTCYYYLRRIRDVMLESSGPRLVEMELPAADFPVGKSASPDDFLPRITITLRAEAVVVFGISGVQSM